MVPLFEQNDAFFRSYMTLPNMVFNYKLFHLNRPNGWLPFLRALEAFLKKASFLFRRLSCHGTLFQDSYYFELTDVMRKKDQVHIRVFLLSRKVFARDVLHCECQCREDGHFGKK